MEERFDSDEELEYTREMQVERFVRERGVKTLLASADAVVSYGTPLVCAGLEVGKELIKYPKVRQLVLAYLLSQQSWTGLAAGWITSKMIE